MSPSDVLDLVMATAPVWGPVAVLAGKFLLNRLPTAQRAILSDVVSSTVQGVEQMYARVPGSGTDKKQQALTLIDAELKRLGVKADPATLNVLLEAAVAALPSSAPAPAPQSQG